MPAELPLHKLFCMNVRARRQQLGLTQAQVAEDLGVAQPSYAAIESGRFEPKLGQVERVARVLRIPAALLLTAQEPQEVSS